MNVISRDKEILKVANKIWSSIMKDFSSRKGLEEMFDGRSVGGIDANVLKEIKACNVLRIYKILKKEIE